MWDITILWHSTFLFMYICQEIQAAAIHTTFLGYNIIKLKAFNLNLFRMLDKQVTFCETEVISIGHRWESRSKIKS